MTHRERQLKIEETKMMLEGWREAERRLMTAEEYYMGSSKLKRTDLTKVAARIKHYENELLKLENGTDYRIRLQRVVPRD